MRQHIGQAGLSIDRDAMALLSSRLGADRFAVRQELDKLLLYKGKTEDPISIADIDAIIGEAVFYYILFIFQFLFLELVTKLVFLLIFIIQHKFKIV